MTEQSAGADNSASWKAGSPVRLSRLYLDALRAADGAGAYRVASSALAQGMGTAELYQRVIAPAMHEIGELWRKGALTVADEHLATALTHRVLAALRPPMHTDATGSESPSGKGRVLLAAVEGEQHALGLRMAADVLEDAGFHAIYLGADVPTEALLQAVASFSPDLLGLSATMPESVPRLHTVADAVARTYPGVGLLVGGQAASGLALGAAFQDLNALTRRLGS